MSVCLYVCLSLRLSVCVSHQPIYLLSFMTLPLSFRFFLFWQFSLIFSKVVYFSIIFSSPSLDGEEEDEKSLASDFQLQHSTFFSLHFSPSSQRFVFSQFFLVSSSLMSLPTNFITLLLFSKKKFLSLVSSSYSNRFFSLLIREWFLLLFFPSWNRSRNQWLVPQNERRWTSSFQSVSKNGFNVERLKSKS